MTQRCFALIKTKQGKNYIKKLNVEIIVQKTLKQLFTKKNLANISGQKRKNAK